MYLDYNTVDAKILKCQVGTFTSQNSVLKLVIIHI